MDENMTTTNAPEEVEDHGTIAGVFVEFWIKLFEFLKYIFYDIYFGK